LIKSTKMDIQISVQNPQKAIALLEFLKSFEMIDTFKLVENSVSQKPLTKNGTSFFDKFHSKTKSGQTLEQIDNQLNILRKEWERDI
jgi:hypothetical protein